MKQKLRHKLEIGVILKCLWALRNEPFYYFETYGKDFIQQYVKQENGKKKLKSSLPKETPPEPILKSISKDA